jgi:hypothetical protein
MMWVVLMKINNKKYPTSGLTVTRLAGLFKSFWFLKSLQFEKWFQTNSTEMPSTVSHSSYPVNVMTQTG